MRQLKTILAISLITISCTSNSQQPIKISILPKRNKIVVAVIDTGIAKEFANSKFLCDEGHKDFTNTTIFDRSGHGTHISGLIDQYVKNMIFDFKMTSIASIVDTDAKYCQIILKWYDNKQKNKLDLSNMVDQEIKAFKRAIEMKVDIINFSGGGDSGFSFEESLMIKAALDAGIIVVVAAGNEHSNINVNPYYPAVLDKRLIVVGNVDRMGAPHSTSNYGDLVDDWEYGVQRTSYGLDNKVMIMTGTSQATAVKTGKLIRQMLNKK